MPARTFAPVFNSGSEVDLAISLKQQAIKIQHSGSEDLTIQSDEEGTLREKLFGSGRARLTAPHPAVRYRQGVAR